MKLKELKYFFESYNIPSLRYLYPTNIELWCAFNKQESREIKSKIVEEINWVLDENEKEKRKIMKYLNQLGIMGPIRFRKIIDMNSFLTEMRENIG